jgi:hypothetical protein
MPGKPKLGWACAWLMVVLVMLLAPSRASAQDIQGHVLELQGDELVVDLSLQHGASRGDLVELWRPLRLKHPVSGRSVSDRFEIGRLRLVQVRDNLALAKLEGQPSRPPAIGDVVILRRAAKPENAVVVATPSTSGDASKQSGKKIDPTAAAPTATMPAAVQQDVEAASVVALFDSLRGSDLSSRIRAYETFARINPKNRFSRTLLEEALLLRRAHRWEKGADKAEPRIRAASFMAPSAVPERQAPTLAVQVEGLARGAVLYTRGASDVNYVATPMRPNGEGFYQAAIPTAQVRAPHVHYFIEAVDPDGHGIPIVSHQESPQVLDVEPEPVSGQARPYEMMATMLTDYADWNNLERNDWAWQTEGSIGIRIADKGLRALRTGFGVYRGRGGSLQELDELNKQPREIGLTYGYLETEFGVSSFTGLIGRAIIGLRERGVTGGAQAFVRLGNDKQTNLLLGGEILGGVGLRGITELQLAAFERFPLMFRTEVTNQPAGDTPSDESATDVSVGRADIGARAIAQLGYRVVPTLTLAARGSYEGRTINHAGPGFGAAVSYQW